MVVYFPLCRLMAGSGSLYEFEDRARQPWRETVPAEAYYGVQTQRAVENFPITGIPISRFGALVKALGAIKEAAALANMDLGQLEPELGKAIVQAAREVQSGALDAHFVVDVIQGGAGTSTNMNANEVIANRALELLGQSSRGVRNTAIRTTT